MSGWHFFLAAMRAVATNGTALLRATALWWVLFTAFAISVSYLMTGQMGSVATLRPDAEGQYPDLVATFAMVSLVINLISIGLVACLALPILTGKDAPNSVLPFPRGSDLVQMIWALVLTSLITVIIAAIVSALSGYAAPYMSLATGFILLPILTVFTFWLIWMLLLRVFAQPLNLTTNPEKRVGFLGIFLASALFSVISIAVFMLGTLAVRSSLTEAIVTSCIGWVLLMFALSAMAVRLKNDE